MSNVEELQQLIGGGWVEGEEYVSQAIGKLLELSSRFTCFARFQVADTHPIRDA